MTAIPSPKVQKVNIEPVTRDDFEQLAHLSMLTDRSARRLLVELGAGVLEQMLQREFRAALGYPVALEMPVPPP